MAIVVNNITKYYGEQKALDKVTFSIEEGEIVGFLGPNGAGKSTLMKILTGYLQPDEGTAIIANDNVLTATKKVQQQIGYLPEHNPLYLDMYVKEYLDFSASVYKINKSNIDHVIEITGLLPEKDKKIGQLSKGYRQRVGIANALLHNPKVLILDEPTTGLDPNQLIEIRNLIKSIRKEKTIFLSTHIMQEVEAICDRIIIIDKGKIVTDKKINEKETEESHSTITFESDVTFEELATIPTFVSAQTQNQKTWDIILKDNNASATLGRWALAQQKIIVELTQKTENISQLFHNQTQKKN